MKTNNKRKEILIMKSKNVKMQPAKVLAKVSLKLSRMSEALKTIKNAK